MEWKNCWYDTRPNAIISKIISKIFVILTHQVQSCFTAKKHDRAKCTVDYIKNHVIFHRDKINHIKERLEYCEECRNYWQLKKQSQ